MVGSVVEIIGAIRGLGQQCPDRLECLEIRVNKKRGQGLPNKDRKRVPITLLIGSRQYSAGIRSTPNNTYIWICRDVRDENNEKVSLASALKLNGFKKNQKVVLKVENGRITVFPLNPSPLITPNKGKF